MGSVYPAGRAGIRKDWSLSPSSYDHRTSLYPSSVPDWSLLPEEERHQTYKKRIYPCFLFVHPCSIVSVTHYNRFLEINRESHLQKFKIKYDECNVYLFGISELIAEAINRAVPTTAGCDSKSRTRMNTTQKIQRLHLPLDTLVWESSSEGLPDNLSTGGSSEGFKFSTDSPFQGRVPSEKVVSPNVEQVQLFPFVPLLTNSAAIRGFCLPLRGYKIEKNALNGCIEILAYRAVRREQNLYLSVRRVPVSNKCVIHRSLGQPCATLRGYAYREVLRSL
ncbi:hypothetical protein HID58_025185 [Brassica napus]|uniref:Uncharacterized protein n=1 Tax=Brassica napus TaxID=3708 RepID=A0ABQ8CKD7_BRANA|nr:hypothetical protein HID58_025185 [Brassica napus]